MLLKSLTLLRTGLPSSVRCFGSLGSGFPKHREVFNDQYYDDGDAKSPYGSSTNDFQDPNNPFTTENPFVPGGVLSSYKKRLGLSAEEVME